MPTRVGVVRALILSGFLLLGTTSPVPAAVIATSTFDSSTEGWTAVTIDNPGNLFPSTASFAAGAGNPGGALRHDAPSESRTSYVSAPPFMVAALHAATGGFVSWDISTINHTNDIFFTDADIEIRAGAVRIHRNVTPPVPPISPTYVRYQLGFGTVDGWLFFDGASFAPATQAQIDSVLAAADSFLIRAEYWSSATPDTTLVDNVVVAGPGPAVILDRATAVPGEVVTMRLVATGNPPGPVDLYVLVVLPASLAPSFGCGNSAPLAFVTNGGTSVTAACASNPPNTFPRYVGSAPLQSGPLLSVVWSPAAPPGVYTFAAVATPPGALADGRIDPADILAGPTMPLTVP